MVGNAGYSLAAAAAGTNMAERKGQADQKAQASANAERRVDSRDKAEKAATFSTTEEQATTSDDRDADGRSPWARIRQLSEEQERPQEKSLDLTGQIGKSLDLSG